MMNGNTRIFIALFALIQAICFNGSAAELTILINNKIQSADSIFKSDSLRPFFDYDRVEFYYTNYDPIIAQKNYEHLGKTKLDTLKKQVIYGSLPTNTSNNYFFENYNQIGFQKRELDTSSFKYLNLVFSEKDTINYTHYPCIRIYRDILVFKKNEKVVGVAKICFECNGFLFSGTTASTSGFGFNEDFEMLKKILRRK